MHRESVVFNQRFSIADCLNLKGRQAFMHADKIIAGAYSHTSSFSLAFLFRADLCFAVSVICIVMVIQDLFPLPTYPECDVVRVTRLHVYIYMRYHNYVNLDHGDVCYCPL